MSDSKHMLLFEESDSGGLQELCEEIFVKEQREDLLSEDITLIIGLWKHGRLKIFDLDRGELNQKIPTKFLKQGLTILPTPDNIEELYDQLLESDKVAPTYYQHRQLGFRQLEDKLVFLADRPIGDISPPKDESRYYLPAVTEPKGTLESWLTVVQQDVIGHINLELALAIGLSAPIAYLLREQKVIAEIPIWALIGQSSTGKTTALRLMASIYGSPEESTGLINDLNATENAFYRSLSDSTGLPLIVDEATCKSNWDFSTTIYNLSKGQDKKRCKTSGELRERFSFSGAIVISGENSLFEQSSANLGIYARMVELTLPWTDDAMHARRISKGFRRNYGTAVYPFMETLLVLGTNRSDVLERLFDDELKMLKDMEKTVTGVDERVMNMYATVTVAAIIAKQVFHLPLHVKKIRELLIKQHGEVSREQTVAETFYYKLLDYVTRNRQYFSQTSGSGKSPLLPINQWGEFATRNMSPVIWITAETFRGFADKVNFSNYKQHLAQLEQQGLIVGFGDNHYTQKHRIGNTKLPCYCIKQSAPPKAKKPKKTSSRKLSPHSDLLKDDADEK